METPEGWSTITLGDILTPEQIKHVMQIVDEAGGDVFEAAAKLKPFFHGIADQLDAKGIVPDFAAYAIPYWIGQAKERETKQEAVSMVDRIMGRGGKPRNN